jgi:probable HAF family extracellular repeat protein
MCAMKSLAVAAFAFHVLACSLYAAGPYRLTDLGPLGEFGNARGLNNNGLVVGDNDASGRLYPVQLGVPSGQQNLGLLSQTSQGRANRINDAGQSVGANDFNPGVGLVPVRWSPDGSVLPLGTLPGGTNGEAYDINAQGVIIGISGIRTGAAPETSHAFKWNSSGLMQDLGELPGGRDYSAAFAINASGVVVGHSEGDGGMYGFKWTSASGMIQLDDLPGAHAFSEAYDLNDLGQVVGVGTTTADPAIANFGVHAVLWDNSTTPIDLGELPSGDDFSIARAINNLNEVVGYSDRGGFHAFLWTHADGMRDLNTLVDGLPNGWTLTKALDINDAGQIVGNASTPEGNRAFLLTPIPEPATLWLVAITLLLAAVGRRTRIC